VGFLTALILVVTLVLKSAPAAGYVAMTGATIALCLVRRHYAGAQRRAQTRRHAHQRGVSS
jgi:hypothetical protein